LATEEGIVTKSEGPVAWIKTQKSAACKSCASRGSCNTMGSGNDMEVEAINTAGAQAGDRVALRFETGPLLKATFLLYVFPVICLLIGSVIGNQLAPSFNSDPSAVSAVFGFLGLFLSVYIVRAKGNQLALKKEYKPEITRIIKRGEVPPAL
jgi:sigma-E factor negative regulatory protein RseC